MSNLTGTTTTERPAELEAAYLVPLSAPTPEVLTRAAAALRDLLGAEPGFDLYTLAGHLSRRRPHFPARAAFAATSLPQLAERLDAFVREKTPAGTVSEGNRTPRILMVFAGQGTQWAGCGRELYDTEPVFRRAVDAVDAAWRGQAGFSLRDACFTASQEDLDEVQQQRTAGSGRMLAVGLDRAATEELLAEIMAGPGRPALEIACENAPASTVIWGPEPDLAPVLARLGQRRVPHRLLRGNIAFHSGAMDAIEADLRASLAFLDGRLPHARVPFISSVTGEVTRNLDSAYWWSNIRRPVRFMTAVRLAARELRPDVVLEVSPHMALTPAVRQCLAGRDRPPACVRTLGRDEDPRLAWHQALGALYRAGVPLDFAARYPRVRPVSHLLPPLPRIRAAPGPTLAAALPGPCREDLELLRGSIREFAGGRPAGPPVPADQFGAVFLTGATGFAGRFVLSELLRHHDHMLVHCLVRAQNAKQALARVQAALQAAGRWDDYLADRIRAWPGDLREPRFGLPELDFRRLCGQVDAVYHLAADSDLRLPYAALREASTHGLRTVLELALRRRPKPLFYASAMGVSA